MKVIHTEITVVVPDNTEPKLVSVWLAEAGHVLVQRHPWDMKIGAAEECRDGCEAEITTGDDDEITIVHV
tara:strand:+ start:7691 stop:7900 length:210 start_codon:yes stop_codon:yes gene_type:complete